MAPLLFAALAVFLTPIAAVAADELRVAVPALPVSLDPQKALTPIERALTREIFEGLVTYDADGRLVPGLAESWIVESGGTGYVFKLRAGLRWSDGRRLEAEDIVDGLKRALDPATRAPLSGALLPIKNAGTFQLGTLEANQALGIVARGDRIEISLEAPSARLLHMLASSLAMPVPRHKLSALGDAWAAPFLVVANGALVPTPAGDGFALKRNPNYAGPAPAAAETVTFVAVHSRDAAIDAVQREAADVALGFDAEPAMGRAGAALRVDAGLATYHWIVNMTRRPFDDRNVRHALAMALDRDGLIDELKLDGARAGFSLVPKGAVAGYEPLIASYGKLQQPERDVIAEVLLLDVDRATAPPIVLAVPDGALHAALAARARDVWSRLGFAVEIVTRPAADHAAAVLAGDFSIAVPVGVEHGADPWPLLFPFSRAAGALNLARYGEVEFEEDLIPADADTNPEYRMNGLRAAEDVLAEDQVAWPLFVFTPRQPVAGRIMGWQPNPNGAHPIKYLSVKRDQTYK